MPNKYPPRPCWYHPDVKDSVAAEFSDEIRAWAVACGVVDPDSDPKTFLALVTIALRECADAYDAGRYLEDFMDWPVTGELIRILDRAYIRMEFATKPFVQRWVVENAVRFPAKQGQQVRCRIGDAEITGEIVAVIASEARAVISVNGSNKNVTLNAEEVSEISERNRPTPTPPPKEVA